MTVNSLTYFPVTGSWVDIEIDTPPDDRSAEVQLPTALVDFIPRLPLGFEFDVSNLLVTPATNEVQLLTMVGTPTGGTFTLAFANVGPSATVPFNATAAQVQTALQGLSSIGAGNAIVTGAAGGPWTITFEGALGATPISTVGAISASPAGLVGDNSAFLETTLVTAGSTQIARNTGVHIDPFTARVTSGVLCTPASPHDIPGVQLVSNSSILGYMDTTVNPPVPRVLYYDIHFYKVVYGPTGVGYLRDRAIIAPTDNTPVDLTDPALTTYPYAPLPG